MGVNRSEEARRVLEVGRLMFWVGLFVTLLGAGKALL